MSRLEKLVRLLESAPNDPLTHYAVALEYLAQQRFDEARAEFDRALELDPNYLAAYYHGARTEIRAERREEARALLSRGIAAAGRLGDRKTEREMRELLETIG